MIIYMNTGFETKSEEADCFLGFLTQAGCSAVKIRTVDFSTPWGHPCFLQVLGQSDRADMLQKGSRAKVGPRWWPRTQAEKKRTKLRPPE